ncbi:uroporphyrinogen-III synthase [Raineyella sp. LH-20]|uniref:uroporphyrinogen-III synthase n=1 Tax=Raineyella sp. LH-20 TaxID=3081204 RepID=UPI002955D8D7|nr:uroporphyrinogen-III synthase [Raineyella sp. LH-20]WOP19421.1 uroporphyrinogen-III synthase [Raineyella sp. LH-20]
MSQQTAGTAEPGALPLLGFRIAVTAHRRADDLIAAFERRGAVVLHVPVLRIGPVAEDAQLLADTRQVLATPPDITIVSTAYGMRRWAEAADAAGLMDDLVEVLGRSRLMIRGTKARGQVRALGLDDSAAPDGELTAELVDLALAEGVAGRTVVVQLHGYTDHRQLDRLRDAGARVLAVEPYRWLSDEDVAAIDQLIDTVVRGALDVVTFTSAPAVDALLDRARDLGALDGFVESLRSGEVTAAAVGPVTAGPLAELGVTVLFPERHRMGAMIKEVTDFLTTERCRVVATGAGPLELRGHAVIVDGEPVQLSPGSMRILRRLAATPGQVVSREGLLAELSPCTTPHALDVAVNRLRAALPDGRVVRTVPRRGHLLVADPAGLG